MNVSNINKISTTIDLYCKANANRNLPNVTKKEHSARVKECFDELEGLFENGGVDSELPLSSLHQLRYALQEFTKTKPSKESRVSELFNSVFTSSRKHKQALEIIEHIDEITASNNVRKGLLFESAAKNMQDLPPQDAKKYAREFIMGIANGSEGIMPTNVGNVIADLKKYVNEEGRSILEAADLFTPYERKTGTLQETPNPSISENISIKLESVKESSSSRIAPDSDLSDTISKLREQRQFRLQNLRDIYKSIIDDPDQKTNTKFFPPTRAWYVGTCRSNGVAPFELEMQKIGSQHGIAVISDSTNRDFPNLHEVLTLDDGIDAAYPQDFVDFSSNEVRVPLLRDPQYGSIIADSVREARIKRGPDWTMTTFNGGDMGEILCNPPCQTIGWVDQVWQNDQSLKGIAIASSLGVQPIMNLTYSESGNTLAGQREDGRPFMVIGQDSYEASKALMEHDLGHSMTDHEVRMAFAIDYGVNTEDLYFVEQPGDFHLDMNMAILGPNTIVVNDAVQAANDFEEDLEAWLKDQGVSEQNPINQCIKAMHITATLKKRFEDKTASDLEKQGFNVVRVGGKFAHRMPFSPEKPVMNFFNMVTATAPDGAKIVVAMGVTDEKYKEKFIQMIGNPPDVEVHFLSPENTQASLALDGGISCRTKTM